MSLTATKDAVHKGSTMVTEQKSNQARTVNDVTEVSKAVVLPEIKGVDILRDATYSVDLERTVEEMALIISKMESQLERVLLLNSVLENDLKVSKEIIVDLQAKANSLEEKAADLEAEMPSKRELQMEVDQLEEERTATQNKIYELKTQYDKIQEELGGLRAKVVQLGTEKEDAVAEVAFLEARQAASRQQHNTLQERINHLKEEKVGFQRKIIALQDECQRIMEDKYKLIREQRELKEDMAELRSQVENKVKERKSYYDSADLLRKG